MSIPDYQSYMLPLLHILQDNKVHSLADYVEKLVKEFQLTNDEIAMLLPSGRQTVVKNRIAWATTYLAKAELIQRTGRGQIQITQRGLNVLAQAPIRIDETILRQSKKFKEFIVGAQSPSGEDQPTSPDIPIATSNKLTPLELLESSYQTLATELKEQILELIKSSPPAFFEQLVVDLLVAMGYGGSRVDAGKAIGGSGDGGVDGVIKEDRLGLDTIYLQAKRWQDVVTRPTVQAFAGSLEGFKAKKGVIITTSRFSKEAHEYVRIIEKRIVLIDGQRLAQLMLEFGIGVTDVAQYTIQRIDTDYFGND